MRKLCCEPGCDDLAEPARNRCSEHLAPWLAKQAGRKAAAKSGAAARAGAEFYNTRRWKEARVAYLSRHPLCADCDSLGLVVGATDVDHITPHRGDARLMWDRKNWQGLCKSCHSRKTAREVFHQQGPAQRWSIPFGLKPSGIPVILVCGPPGAGKSTHVRRAARHGDVIVDFDVFLSEVGGRKWDTDPHKVKAAFARRDAVLRSLADCTTGHAWVIAVAPSRAERRDWRAALGQMTGLVMLNTPAEVCKARILADPTRHHATEAMIAGVDAWWGGFQPDPA